MKIEVDNLEIEVVGYCYNEGAPYCDEILINGVDLSAVLKEQFVEKVLKNYEESLQDDYYDEIRNSREIHEDLKMQKAKDER